MAILLISILKTTRLSVASAFRVDNYKIMDSSAKSGGSNNVSGLDTLRRKSTN